MNFWDTVAGYRLAETLTRELPRLTKMLDLQKNKKTAQKVERIPLSGERSLSDRTYDYLCQEVQEGRKVVSMIHIDGEVIIITE